MKKKNDKIFKDNGGYNKRPSNWLDNPYIARKSSYQEIADYLFKRVCFERTEYDMFGTRIVLEKGQYITSYRTLAEATGCSVKVVLNCLKKMSEGGMIKVESYKKGTIITIIDYDKWQKQKGKKKVVMHYATQQKILEKRNTRKHKKETPIKEQLTTTEPICIKKEVSFKETNTFLKNQKQASGFAKLNKVIADVKYKHKINIIMSKVSDKVANLLRDVDFLESLSEASDDDLRELAKAIARALSIKLDSNKLAFVGKNLVIEIAIEERNKMLLEKEKEKKDLEEKKKQEEEKRRTIEAFKSLDIEESLKDVNASIKEVVAEAGAEDFYIKPNKLLRNEEDIEKDKKRQEEDLKAWKSKDIWNKLTIVKIKDNRAIVVSPDVMDVIALNYNADLKKRVEKIIIASARKHNLYINGVEYENVV